MASLTDRPINKGMKREENQPLLHSLDQNKDRKGDGNADTNKQRFGELLYDTLSSVFTRRGLLWLILSVFSQAVQIITLTNLSNKMGATQVLFLRSSLLLIAAVGISWRKSESYRLFDIVMFIANAFFEVVFIYCTALAGQFIWVGDVTSISVNQQIPSAVLACILFGEALDTLDGAFVVANAIGVVLVSQPSFLFSSTPQFISTSESVWPGFLLAFAALTGCVSGSLFYRAMVYRKVEDAFLSATITAMIGLLVSSCVSTFISFWKFPNSLDDWFLILILWLSTLLTFIPYNKALETENVKTVTVMLTIVIPITTLYDFIVLGRELNVAEIGGVLLILGSSFAMHIRTTWTSQ